MVAGTVTEMHWLTVIGIVAVAYKSITDYELFDITEAGDWTFVHDGTVQSAGVGGVVVSVDKFVLLAPYIGLASTIIVATVATAIYVKCVKRRKEKQ